MALFHGYNEIPKSTVIRPIPSPCKTTVFKPKDSGQKPKGLSIRSKSDMNVFHSTHSTSVKENTYNSKKLNIEEPKKIKLDSSGHQTYSRKEQLKYSNSEYQIAEFKGLTPRKEKKRIDKDTEEVLDDKIFKKPLLKRFVKKVREPENLAHFYDAQHKFDHEHIENLDEGFMDQVLKGKENAIPYEEKDSEMLLSVEIPKFILPSSFDEGYIELPSPEMPYISDDDSL